MKLADKYPKQQTDLGDISLRSANSKRARYMCSQCGTSTDANEGTKRREKLLCKDCFGKKKDNRINQLNDLTGSEWARLSKSVEQYNGIRSEKQKFIGAAFPLSLVEAHIEIYTKKGDMVFDPFVGVGTTSQAAEKLGRKSIGIELNPEFASLAEKDLKNKKNHKIICDDVRNIRKYIKPNTIDFQITSPPYATLLKTIKGNFAYKWREHSDLNVMPNPKPYSKHEKDLGNLSYQDFMEEIIRVFKDTLYVLKNDTYAAWVVKDYRDLKKGSAYVNFHSDIIRAAEIAGLTLWDIRIYDQSRFRPLVVLGYPSRNYYLNIGHSFILIFKKIDNS